MYTFFDIKGELKSEINKQKTLFLLYKLKKMQKVKK